MNGKYLMALLWTIFVVILSAISGNTASKLMVVDFFGIDKLGHAFFYFVMTWLWLRAFSIKSMSHRIFSYAFLISFFVGYVMELGQKFWFEGRSFEYDDMVANTFGALLATWMYYTFIFKQRLANIKDQ